MLDEKALIKLASYADATAIAMLSRDDIEFGLGWKWTPNRVKSAIRDPDVNVAVAKDREVIAGFGIMRYGYDNANLELLAVQRKYRRRGMGIRIVAWLELVAFNAGIYKVTVQLRERNKVAKAFYSKNGFSVVDRVPGYYKYKEAGLIMLKRLGKCTR